ncbi:hypothetical protein ACLOJK_005551 [Asimina triloba]
MERGGGGGEVEEEKRIRGWKALSGAERLLKREVKLSPSRPSIAWPVAHCTAGMTIDSPPWITTRRPKAGKFNHTVVTPLLNLATSTHLSVSFISDHLLQRAVSDEKEKIEAEKESAYGEVVDIDVYIEILPKSSLKTINLALTSLTYFCPCTVRQERRNI